MNKLKIVAIVFLITLVSGSCKKDYPKDIPDWLKDKIKALKKETKNSSKCCYTIDEYSFESKSLYYLSMDYSYEVRVWDSQGSDVCTFLVMPNPTCGSIQNMQDYEFKRRIWRQKEK